MKRALLAGVLLVAALAWLFAGGQDGVRAERQVATPTPVAAEVAPLPTAEAARGRLAMVPVEPGSEAAARGLPMKTSPRPDLAFLAEAARLERGPRPAAVDELVAMAQRGADAESLRAAADRLLADRLALKLAARRWIATRSGEARGEMIPPRPARALVGGFSEK